MRRYEDGCHCGAVKMVFEIDADPASLEIRACGCGFCSRHDARTVSDPNGRLSIEPAAGALTVYSFGLGISDFLLLPGGCYVAVIMEDGRERFGTLNSLMLDARDRLATPAAPRDYGTGDEAGRRARRRRMWTPVVADIA